MCTDISRVNNREWFLATKHSPSPTPMFIVFTCIFLQVICTQYNYFYRRPLKQPINIAFRNVPLNWAMVNKAVCRHFGILYGLRLVFCNQRFCLFVSLCRSERSVHKSHHVWLMGSHSSQMSPLLWGFSCEATVYMHVPVTEYKKMKKWHEKRGS